MRDLVVEKLKEKGWDVSTAADGNNLLIKKRVSGFITSELPYTGNTFISYNTATGEITFLVFENTFEKFLEMYKLY